MSWARVDDGLWEHPKFEALREAGHRDAIALWVLALSYCGKKGNPKVTVREAAMLLCSDEAAAQSACDVLRSTGLFDDDSASKQNRSNIIHDWEQYRSKDEAKSIAGRQGGVNSGKSRRSKREADTKQEPSKDEAKTKQTRTPDPVSVTRYPLPDPVSSEGIISTGAALGNELRKHDVRLVLGAEASFGKYLPCTPAQVAEAVRVTVERTGKPKAAYALTVLDGLRLKPPDAPAQHQPKPRENPRADEHHAWVAIGKKHGVYGLDVHEANQLRTLTPTPEEIDRWCAAASTASPDVGATWRDVIKVARVNAAPLAVAS